MTSQGVYVAASRKKRGKTKTAPAPEPKPEPRKICLHHPHEGLENSLAAHIDMETSLAIELAKSHTALRSARACLQTATTRTLQDRSVQATLAVLEDAIP